MKSYVKNTMWFGSGAVLGLATLSIALASVPIRGRVTDDTAIYQNLSEINVAREKHIDFDKDISSLTQMESKYRESLPSLSQNPRVQSPMQRISQKRYKYRSQSSAQAPDPAARY